MCSAAHLRATVRMAQAFSNGWPAVSSADVVEEVRNEGTRFLRYVTDDMTVAGCCSVLQCVTVCCSVSWCVAEYRLSRCSVLQCVAVCCSMLQCVAV